MGLFVPSAKHFNSIEKALQNLSNDKEFKFHNKIQEMFPALRSYRLNKKVRWETISYIMNNLRNLTTLCVCYSHVASGYKKQEDLKANIQKTLSKLSDKEPCQTLTHLELYNCIQCVSYQTDYYDLVAVRDLTKEEIEAHEFLEWVEWDVARYLISKLPGYGKVWAI